MAGAARSTRCETIDTNIKSNNNNNINNELTSVEERAPIRDSTRPRYE